MPTTINPSNQSIVEHGVQVGAANNLLTSISPGTANQVLMSNGSSANASFKDVSTAGAVTTIFADSGNVSPIDGMIIIDGGSTGLLTVGALDVLELTGTLKVENGGTETTSFVAYSVVCGGTTSVNPLQSVASVGSANQVLTSNGAAALPSFKSVSAAGAVIEIFADSGSATPISGVIIIDGGSTGLLTTAATDVIELTGTLKVDNGGTEVTSFTAYSVLCGGTTSTGPLQNVSGVGTSGQVLTSNGAAALPTWQTNASGYSPATIVVSPTIGQGDYTTIAAALTAASSGQTIYIKEGTYTEDLTLKAGVNLSALGGQGSQSNVTIVGKCSSSVSGKIVIYGMRLQTNNDYFLEVTGILAVNIDLIECYLDCTNNTGINYTNSNSSSQLNIHAPQGNLGTTGIAFWTSSSSGFLNVFGADLYNSGTSSSASNNSAGHVYMSECDLQSVLSTSGTGTIDLLYCNINARNAAPASIASLSHQSSSFGRAFFCRFYSGTATAVTIGASANLSMHFCYIISTNTDAVSGSGTLIESNLSFLSSTTINVGTHSIAASSVPNILGQMTITSGTGAPTASELKGSIYSRKDGSSVNTRMYIATDDVGGWTSIITLT